MSQPLVGVVMGSDSDWSVMSDAAQALKEFGIEYEVEVLSAHRTPERMMEWGKALLLTYQTASHGCLILEHCSS